MSRFKKVTGKDVVWARIGIFGEPGSGKTTTATEIAIGLCKDSPDPKKKKIMFVDTEGVGSDYVARFPEQAGIEMFSVKTHIFTELSSLIDEAVEEGACVIIIDSITHFWMNIQEQFLRDNPRKKEITMSDWKKIKDQWQRDFARKFLTADCHMIICGREGDVYITQRNDKGKLEFVPKGKRMKSERDTQYDPSLLFQMRCYETEEGSNHVAYVIKDRSRALQGKRLNMPTYGSFAPHFKHLNPGNKHHALDLSIQAKRLFADFDEHEERERRILVDRIKSYLDLRGLAGTSKDTKKQKAEILNAAFGSSSSQHIATMDIEFLREGVEKLEHNKTAITEEE